LTKKKKPKVPYVWDPEKKWLLYTKKLGLTQKSRLKTRLQKIVAILDMQEQLAMME
jgi:hypothetical protein